MSLGGRGGRSLYSLPGDIILKGLADVVSKLLQTLDIAVIEKAFGSGRHVQLELIVETNRAEVDVDKFGEGLGLFVGVVEPTGTNGDIQEEGREDQVLSGELIRGLVEIPVLLLAQTRLRLSPGSIRTTTIGIIIMTTATTTQAMRLVVLENLVPVLPVIELWISEYTYK